MNEADRKSIYSNTRELVRLINFRDIDNLLIREGIFTEIIMDDIRSEHSNADHVIRLLEELPKRGPHAFDKFIKILTETGNLRAVQLLKPDDIRVAVAMDTNANLNGSRGDQNDTNVVAAPQTGHTIPEGEAPNLTHVQKSVCFFSGQDIYAMDQRERGICLIINNVKFDDPNYQERHGSDIDARGLDQVFKELHFKVILRDNKSSEQMRELLRNVSQRDHANYNALVVILLSHGEREGVVGTDGKCVSVEEMYTMFDNVNCPSLVHKPKMFFIQACRGKLYDGVTIERTVTDAKISNPGVSESETPSETPRIITERIATITDLCISYSTIDRYVSNRNTVRGTWYARALVEVLLNHAHTHKLRDILTKLEYKVQSFTSWDGVKQATESKTLGWKKFLYFNPGYPE